MDLFTHSDFSINRHFQRSIRIDNNISKEFLEYFILHDTGKKVLNQIANSLTTTNQCAFTLTGPYGTGKSSLALYLQALISDNNKIKKLALNKSKFSAKSSFAKVFLARKKWFVLKLIGSKNDPAQAFAETINQTVKKSWISKGIPSALKTKTKPTVAGVIKGLTNLTLELHKKKYGLLVVTDEMGKYLEYVSGVGSDINLFQEIAENFSNLKLKKQGFPLFIGVLHQPMEEYASALGRSVQEDWQKVQGRFEDIPFSINSEEAVNLIAKAINRKSKANGKIKNLSRTIGKLINGGKSNSSLINAISQCYPLHPLVSLLLSPLSKQRFSNNERSIFSFLNSGEPNGFLHFLKNSNSKKENLYTLDKLFDYLQINLEPSILVSNIGHAWSEATEAIRRAEVTDDNNGIKIAKAMALIDLFGKNLSLFSSKEILTNILDKEKIDITKTLAALENKKIIIYRKFKKAYSLFSGSDINLDEVVEVNKSKISGDADLVLSQLPSLQPVVAKKHFHKTGTQRIYQKFCIVLNDVKKAVDRIMLLETSKVSAGMFIFLIQSKEDSKKEFIEKFNELSRIRFPKPVILGYSKNYKEFFNYALELAALKRVKSTITAIESDAVAKKELNARMSAYQNLLFNSLTQNFEDAIWLFNNQKIKGDNLSIIASNVSDEMFYLAPIIHNELVNRDKLSTISMQGSTNLISRIFNHADKENLEMIGHPPEFGIYLSLIKKHHLHKKTKNGFEFCAPQKKEGNLYKLFEVFNKTIKEKKDPVPLNEIYNLFSKAPFGIKSGLLPLLAATFFKVNEGSLAFYNVDENKIESLVTDYDPRVCEKFVQIPEDLKIMYVRIQGEKQKILDVFKAYVEKRFLNNKTIKNPTPLQILKPIVLKAYNLPAFARKTRQFKDKRVLMLRDELLSTQNPFELLYKKIPEICETQDPDELIKKFDKIWSQLDKVFEEMIEQFKQVILKVFQSDPNTSDIDFATIKEMSKKIGPKDPFSAKINELKNENAWIEQIVSFSANKPANEWNDKDFHEAVLKIEEMVRHFITSYRLYTLREKHSDTKIIDIAIFEGQRPERSSKFYKFKTDSSSVEKVTEDVMKFLEDKKLTESEKGEVVLKVLKKIMNFGDSSKGKMKA